MIKEIGPGKFNIIEDLAKIIWPVSFKDMISTEQISYMLNWMYNQKKLNENHQNGHRYAIYTEGDHPLGFVSYEVLLNKSTLRIHKLYVHHECQKKGIGKKLLDHAVSIANNNKMVYLDLFVNRTNPAVDFYKILGFYVEEEINLDIGNGYFMNDYIMKLKI